MAEMSRTFNFDDFDAQIAEALERNDEAMKPIRRPGEIGSVLCLFSGFGEPTPVTEADLTIEGSPDVVVYDPNQSSLW